MRWWRLCISLLCAPLCALVVSWFVLDWDAADSERFPGGVILRDATGRILRVSLGPGDVDCRPTYLADPDDWIVKAVVASEDGTFWEHGGVRPGSMARAFAQNVFSRRRVSGASTITMQTVRLLRPHEKSYAAKWAEAVRAVKMERARSKRWILTQYLNRAPFGSNLVGIEAAAQGWFGKSAKELGLGEAAMLAGMLQAPSRFRPDRGYNEAVKRRDYVLGRMLELGYITAEQLEGARGVFPAVKRSPRPFEAPHYCDYYLREIVAKRAGDDAAGRDFVMPLDPNLQDVCQHVVADAAAAGGCASAAVVMKVATGEVVALACSGDYFDGKEGQVNTALAPRPAGSTLKPFLVARALELGLIGSESQLLDAPLAVKGYRPANFDGRYRGRVSVREALVESLNLPFVRLCRELGVDRFGAELRSLGFAHLTAPDASYGLGMAIGNVEVTLCELVGAYRRLAASVSPEAYLVAEMLSGEERSAAAFGHVAEVPLPRFAWKTGTSAAYRDAWTVAWNPEYVIGVWCGHLSGGFGDERIVGVKAAAPAVWTIARAMYPQNDGPWFARPAGTEALRERRLPAVEEPTLLQIASPEDGATFAIVPGVGQQRVVATVLGADPDGRLWWYLDGTPVGETTGTAPFAADLTPGRHTLTCADETGRSATTTYLVE